MNLVKPSTTDAPQPLYGDLPIHDMPGHYVRRLHQVAVRLFVEEAGPDLTPVQFAALTAASHQPGIDQARLGALIGYDRATVGGVVDRLEAKGWLERFASEEDRRVKRLRITPRGRTALGRALEAVRRVQQRFVEPLSPTERERFEKLCIKLLTHHMG
jgi:DNA-binding MarR family transcriptional regulator